MVFYYLRKAKKLSPELDWFAPSTVFLKLGVEITCNSWWHHYWQRMRLLMILNSLPDLTTQHGCKSDTWRLWSIGGCETSSHSFHGMEKHKSGQRLKKQCCKTHKSGKMKNSWDQRRVFMELSCTAGKQLLLLRVFDAILGFWRWKTLQKRRRRVR